MVTTKELQEQLGISYKTALFILKTGEVPAIKDFPSDTPREDLIKVAMESEECDEETANRIVDIGQGKWWDDESRDVAKGRRYSGWNQ